MFGCVGVGTSRVRVLVMYAYVRLAIKLVLVCTGGVLQPELDCTQKRVLSAGERTFGGALPHPQL